MDSLHFCWVAASDVLIASFSQHRWERRSDRFKRIPLHRHQQRKLVAALCIFLQGMHGVSGSCNFHSRWDELLQRGMVTKREFFRQNVYSLMHTFPKCFPSAR